MNDTQLLELLDTNPADGMELLKSLYAEPVRLAAAQQLNSARMCRTVSRIPLQPSMHSERSSIRPKAACGDTCLLSPRVRPSAAGAAANSSCRMNNSHSRY